LTIRNPHCGGCTEAADIEYMLRWHEPLGVA
jgi:hypothetical protein